MLLTPLIRRQLRIFTVLAVVALGMTFFNYARVPAMLGVGVYDVTVDFADASGLYPKASVTYRGVKVGIVSDLEVTDDGAVATLRIDDGTEIPADASAELHSTSAIGEQYVDLVDPASGAAAPYLHDGAAIPRARAVEMPQISPVLDSLNRLLRSVPKRETRQVLNQVDEGLGGAGPELGSVIDSSSQLLTEAQTRIDATSSLIASLEPVLATQTELGGSTQAYAASLNELTGALAVDDVASLRELLRSGPGGLDEARQTLNELQPTLPLLLQNLTTNAQVLNTYLPELRQTLVVYPATVARLQTAVNPRRAFGDVQLDLRATANEPPVCSSGYLPVGARRDPTDTTTREVDILAHCRVAASDPIAVRGARNLPCPNGAGRGPLPAACGIRFRGGVWPGSSGTVAYDLAVGQDDGDLDLAIAEARRRLGEADLWQVLVLAPLRTP